MAELARLPELTAEELGVLHDALAAHASRLATILDTASSDLFTQRFSHELAIVRSLDTAVLEAMPR